MLVFVVKSFKTNKDPFLLRNAKKNSRVTLSLTGLDSHWERHEIDVADVNSDRNIFPILHLSRAIGPEGDTADLQDSVAIGLVLVLETVHRQIRTRDLQLYKLTGSKIRGRIVFRVFELQLELEAGFAKSQLWSLGARGLGEGEVGSNIS